ncbi:unnamed protein product [Clavelina lepadiformis]
MSNIIGKEATRVNQRNKFLKVIEELRFSRKQTLLLEKRVELLQTEKLRLCSEVETLSSELMALRASHKEMEANCIKLQRPDDNLNSIDENKRLKIALETSESTITQLKSRIATFIQEKNSLEKKLVECEQNLHVSQKTSNYFSNRVDQFQATIDKINKQLEQMTDAQRKLEKNTQVATSINKELLLTHEYQKCIISDLRKDKLDLGDQLMTLESNLKLMENKKLSDNLHSSQSLQTELEKLKLENQTLLKDKDVLNGRLKSIETLLKNAIDSSQNAHQLLKQKEFQHQTTVCELQEKLESSSLEVCALQNKLREKIDNFSAVDENNEAVASSKTNIIQDGPGAVVNVDQK